ncbi:MAG: ribosome small subunit-dependent GTPase A [Epulopiscium sp. Nuni2H_MBin003]|nr:MAG: ribosome small subunit-dependent GTPase A [Epulopiscium sp. Nuni2H_MBin003]
MEGKIIKGIAGFYYVQTDERVYECKARGKFRNDKQSPLIGDLVKVSITDYVGSTDYLQGSIEEILPRKNQLIRPPVANVDQGLIVFSLSYPAMNIDLLDRFLVMMEKANIHAIIILNKLDDIKSDEYKKIVKGYKLTGYEIYTISAKNNQNVELIAELLKDKTSFFAGPSGVGKSTILNSICPNFALQTGEVSSKIKRGKHTTRHVELLKLDNSGYVLDTPGFTSLQFANVTEQELKDCFIEFRKYASECKFKECNHIHEPNCKVKEAFENNLIYKSRYNSYVSYYEELKNNKKW